MTRKLVLAILALELLACGSSYKSAPQESSGEVLPASAIASDEARSFAESAAPGAPPPQRGREEPAGERMIIRTGAVTLRCEDTATSFERLVRLAERLGGYVSDSSATPVTEEVMERRATLRVPAQEFEAALREVRTLGRKVLEEHTSSQDVTEEFVDLGARLRNLEATEKELLQILVEVREKARKASEVLEVYEAIKGVRAEIEQSKGRIQYLERQVEMCTIQVTLAPVLPDQPVIEPEGWSGLRVVRDALRKLVVGLQLLANLAIYLLLFVLPIVLLIAIPLYLVVRLALWATRRRKAPKG